MNSRNPAPLIKLDSAPDIQGPAKTVIGIGNQRQVGGIGNTCGIVDHFRHGQQAHIGIAETGDGRPRSGHIHRLKACFRNQAGIHGIHNTRGHDRAFTGQ